MEYKSKFTGAEIDAILERCVFPSFFFDALTQNAITREVIDEMYQYMTELNMGVLHDVRLGMNLEMTARNEVTMTTDLKIVNDNLRIEFLIFGYDNDGVVHEESFKVEYPLTPEQ